MREHDLDLEEDEIVDIEFIGDKTTIDITVEDTHLFFANDIYTHNSGYQQEIIKGEHVAEAFEKVMVSDFIASVSRTSLDKQSGTGRFHIIKNRMGPDGMTLFAEMDLGIGDIKVHDMEDKQLKETMKQTGLNESDVLKMKLKDRFKQVKKFEDENSSDFG